MTQLAQLKPELHPLKKPPPKDMSWDNAMIAVFTQLLPLIMGMQIGIKLKHDLDLGIVDRKVITNKFGAEVEIVTISAT